MEEVKEPTEESLESTNQEEDGKKQNDIYDDEESDFESDDDDQTATLLNGEKGIDYHSYKYTVQ